MDDALAVAAEASKLAIEEAASRDNEFSRDDVNQATEDLKSMEGMLLDTMEKVAKSSNPIVAEIGRDFISHAQKSGTAVGRQVMNALDALKDLPREGKETIITGAVTATSVLAQIGSGILMGIAESLQSLQSKK